MEHLVKLTSVSELLNLTKADLISLMADQWEDEGLTEGEGIGNFTLSLMRWVEGRIKELED